MTYEKMYYKVNNQLSLGQEKEALLFHYLTLTPGTIQAAISGVAI